MEIKGALSPAVLEVLDRRNYATWSVRVKTYLMAQDLWEVVEATLDPPNQEDDQDEALKEIVEATLDPPKQEDDQDEAASKASSKKNFMALHVIQISWGPDAFYQIRNISSAKSAWNRLATNYDVPKKKNSGLYPSLQCNKVNLLLVEKVNLIIIEKVYIILVWKSKYTLSGERIIK